MRPLLTPVQEEYIMSIGVFRQGTFDPTMRLLVDVESKATGDIWRGEYQQKYVEDICSKAGRPQKLQNFVQMMQTAMLRHQTSTVYLDLLTQHDLVMLKARRQGQTVSQPSEPENPRGKRYLILTLQDPDKVHFPMPLSYLEDPGLDVLRRTLTRMSNSVAGLNQSGAWSEQLPAAAMHSTAKSVSSLSQLEVENHYLRGEIEGIERTFAATHGEQFFTQAQQTLDNESQFDSYRQQAEDQMRQIQTEVFEKERELNRLQREIHRLRSGT